MRMLCTLSLLISTFFLIAGCSLNGAMSSDSYALIYGVSEYNIITDLSYTDDDALAMDELLSAKGYKTTLRINSEATLTALQNDIERLQDKITAQDTFLFYFSGHGGRHYDFFGNFVEEGEEEPDSADSDNEWILFSGSLKNDDYESWSDTAANEETLRKMISPLDTDKKIIIIDACNSGGFIYNPTDIEGIPSDYKKNITENEEKVIQKAVTLYFDSKNKSNHDITFEDAVIMSASGEQEYSLELHSISHGLFTYYLLKTPAKADLNGDGYITTTEAHSYAAAAIDTNWNPYVSSQFNYHPHISGGPIDLVLFPAD
jgi:hypothetical protein